MYIFKKVVFILILCFAFSANACAGDSFRNRINEAENAGFQNERGWDAVRIFAGSNHSLQTFRNRINEAENAGFQNERGWDAVRIFAGSRHQL